ncbi:MAG: phosphotransferase enzyme family protein [Acidimicrobiia bacterium]
MEHRPAREIDLRDGARSNRITEAGRRFQVRLVEHLRAEGYPALHTRPMSMPGGDGYDPANPAHLLEAGRFLGRYHEVARRFPSRLRANGRPALPSLERRGPDALAKFTAVADPVVRPSQRARLTRATSYLWSQFIRVPEALSGVVPLLPRVVIHASYEPGVLIFQGDRVCGVTGFDRAAYDLRALDLGSCLRAFAARTPGTGAGVGLDFERAGALMAAYHEVEPVGDDELGALPLICRAHHLTAVLTTTTAFLRRYERVPRPEAEVRELLDGIERHADWTRWLELGEPEVLAALRSALVP